jgi:Enoyl-CoA hydratase/carnithine racemase
MDAQEAERAGLVSRVVPADKLLEEALGVAAKIASYSLPVAMMIKESSTAPTRPLSEGRAVRAAPVPFAVRARRPEGRHGGLVEKRPAKFTGRQGGPGTPPGIHCPAASQPVYPRLRFSPTRPAGRVRMKSS